MTLDLYYLPQDFDPKSTACLDMGYRVTLVDKSWLLRHVSRQKVSRMSTPLKVRRIGVLRHKSEEYIARFLYFLEIDSIGKPVYILLRCEIHLVEGLRANLSIENDIISLENFIIDIEKKTMLIGSCGIIVSISVRQRKQFLIRKLLTCELTVIPP